MFRGASEETEESVAAEVHLAWAGSQGWRPLLNVNIIMLEQNYIFYVNNFLIFFILLSYGHCHRSLSQVTVSPRCNLISRCNLILRWDETFRNEKFCIFLGEVLLLLEFFTFRTSFAPLHIRFSCLFFQLCTFPRVFCHFHFSQSWTKKYETRFAWHSREYAIRNTKLSTLAATVYTDVCLSLSSKGLLSVFSIIK